MFSITLVIFSALAFPIIFFDEYHFSSGDEISSFALTYSIVEKNTFEITDYAKNHHLESSIAYKDNKNYSKYPPGLSFMAIPFYLLGKFIGINIGLKGRILERYLFFCCSLLNSLTAAYTTVLVYDICKLLKGSEKACLITAYSYALGTIALIYARTFFSHSLTTFLVVLSVYLLILATKEQENEKRSIFISGLAIGLSFVVRYSSFLIIPLLLIFLIFHNRINKIWLFLVPVIFLFGLVLWYNYVCFGNPFATGYDYSEYGAESSYFTTPTYIGLFGLLLGLEKGLFIYCPILFFSIFGFYLLLKNNKEDKSVVVLFISIFAVITLFYAHWWFWSGGWCWGPRLIHSTVPFLMIPLFKFVDEFEKNRNLQLFLRVIISLNIFITVLGIYDWPYTEFPLGDAIKRLFIHQLRAEFSILMTLILLAVFFIENRKYIF